MANSSIISVIKDRIITEIINDPAFFYGINSPDIPDAEHADELVNSHIFRYHQNPNTLNKAITFLTLQVHIAKENELESQNLWIHPKVEIWIISHESCMKVDNISGVRADRNDYISQLLDMKFNGRTSLGTENGGNCLNLLGKLNLVENSEGAVGQSYLYRKMIFVTRDLNSSACERW